MISKVALSSTDASGIATPAAADSGESGVFDNLLTMQSQASDDAAAAANARLAVPLEGIDPLADLLEDTAEESTDDSAADGGESAEGALWFLASLVPVPKISPPASAAGAAVAGHFHGDVPLTAAPPQAAAQAGTPTDLAQAFAFGPTGGGAESGETNPSAPNPKFALAPVIDTTTWNSITTPAELFAQATKQANVERADPAPLASHVRDPRWADDLGNRLASMVRTGESSASLQLTPPDLGPLEVNVSVRDNQATVHFGASNAETRALLEASMPRLREMLASQGFALMDSSVSHGFARQTRHESAGTPRVDAIGESPMPAVQPIHITGLLDLYA